MPDKQTFRKISDAGHGWLEVPVQIFNQWGGQASDYSYYCPTRRCVYLEEDSDMPKFLDMLSADFYEVEQVWEDDHCFVRQLPRFISDPIS